MHSMMTWRFLPLNSHIMSSAPGSEGRGGGHRGDGVGDEGWRGGGVGGAGRGEDASNFWDEALFQVFFSPLISLSLHIHTYTLSPSASLSRSSPRIPFSPYGPIPPIRPTCITCGQPEDSHSPPHLRVDAACIHQTVSATV
jgi:hypothetical protein